MYQILEYLGYHILQNQEHGKKNISVDKSHLLKDKLAACIRLLSTSQSSQNLKIRVLNNTEIIRLMAMNKITWNANGFSVVCFVY
jgi:uncharacterized protein involved in tolerance to divalent cations